MRPAPVLNSSYIQRNNNHMDYIGHLSKDRKLGRVVSAQEPISLKARKNIPLRLCASIMSQQLSTKVAKVIFTRFLELYDGAEPTPQQIVDTPFDKLRGIGLSNAKALYVLNVAHFALEHGLDDKKVRKMGDKEVIELLTQIKGVGRWTVEMLLMFTLGRPDVFAVDDYGIQVAMKKVYNLDDTDKKAFKQRMVEISAKWSPYRTYACLHLWQWKDGA
ncbi:MAG: DNA-3-methyladenine glycosylase 2 family protein [Flaviaesturariibacter sp.]|nr:DNA-3-methyladenine glycosylase 2 family protein [Flaviaesturariibacter sp.]